MWETIKREKQAKVAIVLFLILAAWWLINPSVVPPGIKRFFGDFPSIYGVMALWGAVSGLAIFQKWGGTKSVMGKAILMFSLGLLAQEMGQLIYAYYAFFQNVEVPYPSLGDIGYFGSIPLYIYGVWLLAQASGVRIKLRSYVHQIQALLIPLVMLGVGYYLFLLNYTIDWSNPIKVFLDFGYPLTQAIYVSLAILTYLLSRDVLGGIMKNIILFILFALVIQFLSDYTFLYQSSRGIWAAGGFNDFMYLISYFLMTLGLIQFKTVLGKLHDGSKE